MNSRKDGGGSPGDEDNTKIKNTGLKNVVLQ